MEVIEFISGQLHCGTLPLDQDLIKNMENFIVINESERADRAWLSVLSRLRSQRPRLAQMRDAPPQTSRPRILWRLDTMLDRHEDAIKEFFQISHLSEKDIDEFFEYLRSRIEVDVEVRDILRPHFPSLVELRPKSAAALLDERCGDTIDTILAATASVYHRLEFCESLLEMGRLRGDAASAYLRDLCVTRPRHIKNFLIKNPGIVRPEVALHLVQEFGLEGAEEAICLEAVGDASGALDALLRQISLTDDEETRSELINEASALCLRVGPTIPADMAADMWTRLLRSATTVPQSLMFEAIAYLPLEELVIRTCDSVSIATSVLRGGTWRRDVWRFASHIVQRESHVGLACALTSARRGLAVRGKCVRCGSTLSEGAGVRSGHCARATHAECMAEETCACGRLVPSSTVTLPPVPRRLNNSTYEYDLVLVAPPRPDLEGVV